nr:MAG TPA: PemK-like protein [Caudoviricetes sp.]
MCDRNTEEYHRGDVVWCNFGVSTGSEQGGTRPAIIIQNNIGNKYSPCLIVVPVSSQWKKPMITHVGLNASETGLNKCSVAMAEQIQTVDKSKISGKVSHLSDAMMRYIDKAIAASLGLNRNYNAYAV